MKRPAGPWLQRGLQCTSGERGEGREIRGSANEARCGKLFLMKLPKLTAVIEPEDDWFVATCPELA